MVQVQAPKPKGKKKGRGTHALKSMFGTFAARLKFGVRTCREEPTPPTSPGTYHRTVSSIDGSIEYVKVGSQVNNPAQVTTLCMIELPLSHSIRFLFYITVT